MARVRFFKNRAGQRIAYAVEGDGPLLALPAWWISHLERDAEDPAYVRFFSRLAAHFRVVRYDRVGAGLSDRARRLFTLASEVADFSSLVEHLGEPRLNLLGCSCAGPVALAYAAEHPDRVDRVVLYGSYLHGATLGPKDVQAALVALLRTGRLGSRTLADLFHPNADAQTRRRFNSLQRDSAEPEIAARLLELTYALDARPFADAVRAPVLVLHRQNDRAIRHHEARTLAAHLPEATLTTLPGGAHMPWHEDGDGVADAITAFVDRAASAPQTSELRRDGEVWRLRFGGRQILLRHSKGLGDLARLLDRPGDAIHVYDLMGLEAPEPRAADVTLDRQALQAVRRRLEDLDERIADLGRQPKLVAEREALLAQLSADLGRNRRARKLADPVERARKTVTARLRDAIRHVKGADPGAGEHLETSVQTGIHCTYTPSPPMRWTVSPGPI